MLDIKLFRENPDIIKASEKKRGKDPKLVDEVLKHDKLWREALQRTEKLKHKRNVISRDIASLKAKGKSGNEKIREMQKVNKDIEKNDRLISEYLARRDSIRYKIGNVLHDDVPEGMTEESNRVLRSWGKSKLNFKPKSHVDILKDLNLGDTERASELSGSRFYFLKNELVLLNFALQRFAVEFLEKNRFTPMYTPFMLSGKPMKAAAELGDFESSLYKIEGEDLYLIATAEQTLAAYHMNEVFELKDLPKAYAGFSTNFRREAGSHGKDTKGIFRAHQFDKVEQYVLCHPKDSGEWFHKLIGNAENLYRKLELPYRIVNIASGEMNDNASLKYDLEVFFPAQGVYREVVSCSNCTDYQPRKLDIRYLDKDGERKYVHALNATAIATQRTLAAIIENYQNKDGTVTVPKALKPYVNFRKIG